MKIEIIAAAGADCQRLSARIEELISGSEKNCELIENTNPESLKRFGISKAPALVIDGEVKFSGSVPSDQELRSMLGIEPSEENNSFSPRRPESANLKPFRYILIAVMIFSLAAVIFRYMSGSSCFSGSCGIGAGSNHGIGTDAAARTFNENPQRAENPDVIVYYFHSGNRDQTCRDIECDTAMILSLEFSDLLIAGIIDWRVINIDEPENVHFLNNFQVSAETVVLSRLDGGKEVEFKRLDSVKDHLGDIDALKQYITREVKAYLNRG
ncbi:redox-active disulfide protein 2 [Limihaloglobus sulfuriphilus]|uniref:Redox-active disulfide protein 2 n=1 Tax=Limihaloglobus sulfuriphilus TaxID=1851148 RepID=A0A1Q2MF45_9BACT|nr:nitrophenyl compound nitroreductase subunit ArsF family protein [Limihaloglobus sulfuriphilus]AQQ71325.1 redox-active disulfide protein 2 [Limihaloglobus sulfuriphilus]